METNPISRLHGTRFNFNNINLTIMFNHRRVQTFVAERAQQIFKL